jgi:hypothetical protein
MNFIVLVIFALAFQQVDSKPYAIHYPKTVPTTPIAEKDEVLKVKVTFAIGTD